MPFAEDLRELAYYLVYGERDPNQAYLRRGVSTAYYALFHLLIDEAVGKWAVERQRNTLARTFEHRRMRNTAERVSQKARSGSDISAGLITVARSFVELQQDREIADYDNSKVWSGEEAFGSLNLLDDAVSAWQELRDSDEAEDFLLQLFLTKLPPQ